MRIGIYADAHFCVNSSVISGKGADDRYSRRLDSLVASFRWMYNLFAEQGVSLIVNCGDLTDSDTLRPDENSALAEALSYSRGCREIHLLGNHEIMDSCRHFCSVSLLAGYPNLELISSPCFSEECGLSLVLLPFSSDETAVGNMQEMIANMDTPCLVFSHLSFFGDGLPNIFRNDCGIDKGKALANPNVKRIFNGHIHDALERGRYCQVGSMVGNGFGDSYAEHYPGVIVYDTETDKITRFVNPHTYLYFRYKAGSIGELHTMLINEKSKNRRAVQATVPLNLRDFASKYLSENGVRFGLEEFRVRTEISACARIEQASQAQENGQETENAVLADIKRISDNKSIYELLRLFILQEQGIPYPQATMVDFLERYLFDATNQT